MVEKSLVNSQSSVGIEKIFTFSVGEGEKSKTFSLPDKSFYTTREIGKLLGLTYQAITPIIAGKHDAGKVEKIGGRYIVNDKNTVVRIVTRALENRQPLSTLHARKETKEFTLPDGKTKIEIKGSKRIAIMQALENNGWKLSGNQEEIKGIKWKDVLNPISGLNEYFMKKRIGFKIIPDDSVVTKAGEKSSFILVEINSKNEPELPKPIEKILDEDNSPYNNWPVAKTFTDPLSLSKIIDVLAINGVIKTPEEQERISASNPTFSQAQKSLED